MEEVSMCRICQVVGVRMQSIVSTHLQKMFETLTKTPFVTNDDRPQGVCHMCYRKLEKCYRLQKHCLRSEEQFMQMINSNIPAPLDLRVNLHTRRLARTDVFTLSMGHVAEGEEEVTDTEVRGGGSHLSSGDVDPGEPTARLEADSRPLDLRVDLHSRRLARLARTNVFILSMGHVEEDEEELKDSEVRGSGSHLASDNTVPVEPTPTIQEDSGPVDLRVDLHTRRLATLVVTLSDVLNTCLGHGEEDEQELGNSEAIAGGSPLPSGDTVPVEPTPAIQEDSKPLDMRVDIHTSTLARLALALTDVLILSLGYAEEDEEQPPDSGVRGGPSPLPTGDTVPVETTPEIQEDSGPLDMRVYLHTRRPARLAPTNVSNPSVGHVEKDEQELTDSEVRGGGSPLLSGDTGAVELTPSTSRPLDSRVDLNTKRLAEQARADVKNLQTGHEENKQEIRDSEVTGGGTPSASDENPLKLPETKKVPKDRQTDKHNTKDNTQRKHKEHKCHICQRHFTLKNRLDIHLEKHAETKPKCHLCGKCFSRVESLRRHLLLHSGGKPYQCVECKKCFTERVEVERHVRTHTENKTYQCDICKKIFPQSTYLLKHMRSHDPNWYQCFVCQKFFKGRSNLLRHVCKKGNSSKDKMSLLRPPI